MAYSALFIAHKVTLIEKASADEAKQRFFRNMAEDTLQKDPTNANVWIMLALRCEDGDELRKMTEPNPFFMHLMDRVKSLDPASPYAEY